MLGFLDLWGFLLVVVIFLPLERLLGLRKEQRVFRKWWWSDLIYFLVNGLPIGAVLASIIFVTEMISGRLVPPGLRATVAGQPYWLQVAEATILADLGFYTAHRMFHGIPWLWRFHAVHHSIEELDWLAAARVHPLDQGVTAGMMMLPLVALGFHQAAVAGFGAIYFWHSVLLHANVRMSFGPLRWLVASPEFHHWHHAYRPGAQVANYAGQLSLLDWLFGTMHMGRGGAPERYGIDDPVPHTYLAHLLYPFRGQARPVRMVATASR